MTVTRGSRVIQHLRFCLLSRCLQRSLVELFAPRQGCLLGFAVERLGALTWGTHVGHLRGLQRRLRLTQRHIELAVGPSVSHFL